MFSEFCNKSTALNVIEILLCMYVITTMYVICLITGQIKTKVKQQREEIEVKNICNDLHEFQPLSK